jgi:hypothetical protein
VGACVEDVNAGTFDEKISKHLDAGEREVEGELGNEDIADALAVVLRERLDGARPGGDVFADTVTRFTAHDGGFSNDVEEEIGNILEKMLHGANRGAGSFNILLLFLVIVVVVVQGNHHLIVKMMFFSIGTRRRRVLKLLLFLGTGSRRGEGRSGIVLVVSVVELLFSLSTMSRSFRVWHDNFIQEILVVVIVVASIGVLKTGVVIERVWGSLLLLLLTLLRNGARSSRAAVAVRVVAWGVADINLGEVVVRVITEGSLESNLLILVVVVGSRGSRLRSGRGRHFDFWGFCCF